MKLLRSAALAALLPIVAISPAAAEIPDIDSSGWATDPKDYGMKAREYIQAETRAFFADFIERAGLNTFYHFPGIASAEDRWVVSPNNDTIYSVAIVNVSQGFTLELPDMGDRFVSVHIIDENHMSPFYLYGGETRSFTADQFETEYVVVGMRTGTDATEEDVRFVLEELHPQYAITGALDVDDMPRPDLDVLARVRKALVAEYGNLTSTSGAMQPRSDLVEDWEFFTYVTAGAWGLSMDENAMYTPYALPGAKGGTCYTATYPPVPAKEFFSITVYGPEKYLMSNVDNIISSNRGIATNNDGSFTVVFGGEDCRDLAPNYAFTPEDGWNFLMRAYRPDVAAFQNYQMPDVIPVE